MNMTSIANYINLSLLSVLKFPSCTFVVKAMGRLCEVFLNKQNIVDASSNMVCNIYLKKFIAK
jgi:hypothetical protein